jgi:hypothetical protein
MGRNSNLLSKRDTPLSVNTRKQSSNMASGSKKQNKRRASSQTKNNIPGAFASFNEEVNTGSMINE